MNLTVQRSHALNCTIGELLIDGVHECWTLEPPIREVKGEPVEAWKVKNQTAIPAGRYRVVIDYSPRFDRDMPHVCDVPGFEGVRIHIGNTARDTDGCVLLGMNKGDTAVLQSKSAFDALFPKLQAALNDGGEIWIEYINPSGATT